MKVLWNSVAPWLPTGYGQQTKVFTPRIRDLGHDVALSAYVGIEGVVSTWEDMTVYPGDLTKFNKRYLRKYAKRHSTSGNVEEVQIIHLTDVWTWHEQRYGGFADFKGLRMAAWCPVDHDPCPPRVINALRDYECRPIAMSRFGEDRLKNAGLDPLYVPHGIDTNAFRPWDERDDVREAMGVDKDAFVVGIVANNQGQTLSRKAFPQMFQAFSMFLDKHPDSVLYLHTDVFGLNFGIELMELAATFGIPETALASVNQDAYWLGEITWPQMARVYSSMDVLLSTSYGEGFGIPIIEAQACGTPVIATDWTSMTELVGSGWLVDGDPFWHYDQNVFWKIPAIAEIVSALEMAYKSRGDQAIRDTARDFALQYDADRVTQEHWIPVLEALDKPREVPPLNRAMRRQKLKAAA